MGLCLGAVLGCFLVVHGRFMRGLWIFLIRDPFLRLNSWLPLLWFAYDSCMGNSGLRLDGELWPANLEQRNSWFRMGGMPMVCRTSCQL